MNKWSKVVSATAAAALIGFGGFAVTSANAATDDQIASYLTDAVAAQLGLSSTDALHQIIVDAMANNLIDPSVTAAAGATVDGVSTLTPEELAALLDSNLTQQLGTIEQNLIDLGVNPDPKQPVDPPVVVGDDSDDTMDDDSGDVNEVESDDVDDETDVAGVSDDDGDDDGTYASDDQTDEQDDDQGDDQDED
jgi:hypothetical protein